MASTRQKQYLDVLYSLGCQWFHPSRRPVDRLPGHRNAVCPDNYMGSHSILFTFDTYTQTGSMLTLKLNDQWTVQGGMNAGTDMAPWYRGARTGGCAAFAGSSQVDHDATYVHG